MKASIDISMYPLSNDYSQKIIDFIIRLRQNNKKIRVETNGMSTQLFGEYNDLIELLKLELFKELEAKTVFVLKISSGERTIENLNDKLK